MRLKCKWYNVISLCISRNLFGLAGNFLIKGIMKKCEVSMHDSDFPTKFFSGCILASIVLQSTLGLFLLS